MPAERVAMRQAREIIRLKFSSNIPTREIARRLGLAPSTVRETLKRFEVSGLGWPLPEGIGESELEAALYANRRGKRGHRRHEEPDWRAVRAELKRKHVTLLIVWDEYIAANPGGYSYSRFCDLYRNWEARLPVTMRQTHAAGERLFVDYAGDGVPVVVDRLTGEIRMAQIPAAFIPPERRPGPSTTTRHEPEHAPARKPPMVGILAALPEDLPAIGALGHITVQVPLPRSRSEFDAALSQAKQLGQNLMIAVAVRSNIQTPDLKIDTAALTRVLGTSLAGNPGAADPSFAGVLIVDDPCHVDQRGRKWNLSSADLAAGYNAVKAVDSHINVVVNFSKSSCLDTFVTQAAPGTHLADVGFLKAFYYKWSTTPNLFDSYAISARAARAFDPSMRIIPKLGVYETVGNEASAWPSNEWVEKRAAEFAASGAFDGLFLYNYRPLEPTEQKTIANVITDPAWIATMKKVFAGAGG